MGVSATNSNRRVRTPGVAGVGGWPPPLIRSNRLLGERGIRVPSACILYIEIVLRNDLRSALTHSQPWDFQQNKTLNALAHISQPRRAPSVPVLLSTEHDMGELPGKDNGDVWTNDN